MNMITDLLTTLGNHFSLVVIGSVELLAAVVLAGNAVRTKVMLRRKPVIHGGEKIFLREMDCREDEACIVLRQSDCMPVYATDERQQMASYGSEQFRRFLNRMSHEIRTPMNGIMGMLTLAEGTLEDQAPARSYLDKAEELSDHLLALINDILDMSRIEAGKVELEKD